MTRVKTLIAKVSSDTPLGKYKMVVYRFSDGSYSLKQDRKAVEPSAMDGVCLDSQFGLNHFYPEVHWLIDHLDHITTSQVPAHDCVCPHCTYDEGTRYEYASQVRVLAQRLGLKLSSEIQCQSN